MNSMLGALIGDAAGATLEFYNRTITEEIALNAMTMPGGGPIRVGPGQITDDGELTLALWDALNRCVSNDTNTLLLSVMRGYSDWYQSCPFDIGQTCSMAFEEYYNLFENNENVSITDSTLIQASKDIVYSMNRHSEANGALMRATAIATWFATNTVYGPLDGAQFAKEDAKLSHPNLVCQETNSIYVFALIHLLRGVSPQDALKSVNEYVEHYVTSDKVRKWYFEESLDISELNCKHQIGHVRWGFVLAIYFLRNPKISYEEAIKITLMKGGDTDTNACIVGGMVGCYGSIPDYMKKPVVDFDCTQGHKRSHIRPACYSVKRVIGKLL